DRDNDTLRLIFADWLEEHGDAARAEFIRAEVRMAQIRVWTPEYGVLADRHDQLWNEHMDEGVGHVPPSLREGCLIKRGFVSELLCSAEDWLRDGERMHEFAPLLESLQLECVREELVPKLASAPHLAPFTALVLHNQRIGDAGIATLAVSPY